MERSGILSAGNFIVDRIRRIDAYPEENMLANIESETRSNGGGAYNVLKDLSAMGVAYPLIAAGRIGDDPEGVWIRDDCRAHGIDVDWLSGDAEHPTSYTEVMTVAGTGRRTFFHRRGANAHFDGGALEFGRTPAKIFHLAYLMLLDSLDEFGDDGRSRASHLLERARTSGLMTSIDLVSAENSSFRETVVSSLPFTDHLLINEVEAARVIGRTFDPRDQRGLTKAAGELLDLGVRQAVVLHTEHGAVCLRSDGELFSQGSVGIPDGYLKGANGAGDAFAAGYLHGLHEGFATEAALELAVCTAASCLSEPSPSLGVGSIECNLELGRKYGYHPF